MPKIIIKKKMVKKALGKARKTKDGKPITSSSVGKQHQMVNIKIDLSKKRTTIPNSMPVKKQPSQSFFIPYQTQQQPDLSGLLNYITKTSQSQPIMVNKQKEEIPVPITLTKTKEEPSISERIELMKKNQEDVLQKFRIGGGKPKENMTTIEEQLELRLNKAKEELEYYKREEERRRNQEKKQRQINAEKQKERRKQKKEEYKQQEPEVPFWEPTLEEEAVGEGGGGGGGGGGEEETENIMTLNKLNKMNLDQLQTLAMNNGVEWAVSIINKKGKEVTKYKSKKELIEELKTLFNL